jgi:hypothetical protein
MERKAQASVEYLMILAAVIIISLAVIGVITAFPSISSGISRRETLSYWQSADIGIEQPFISASSSAGTSKITLRNNQNFPIIVSSLYFGGLSVEYSGLPITLSPGGTRLVSLVAQVPCTSGGQLYVISDIRIGFADAANQGNLFNFTGIRPLIGTCQS